MTKSLTDADVRREIAEGSTTALWRLAGAIERNGVDFPGGVPASRAADLLEIAETEPWERSSHKEGATADLFQPLCIIPKEDGKRYRSLLPEDLTDDDEGPIRALATACKHALVRAHLAEILWVRFKKYPDVRMALDARFEAAPTLDPEDYWPVIVSNLGRATILIQSTRANERIPALLAAADDAMAKLRASSYPFALPVLADMLCHTLLLRKDGRDAFTAARAAAWETAIGSVGQQLRADGHHGHDVLIVAHTWASRWHEPDRVKDAAREVVAQLREVAAASDHSIAPMFRERALRAALDFGLSDLAQIARLELMEAVKLSIPTFKQYSEEFELPTELVRAVDTIVQRSPDCAAAVRSLALLPGLLEIDRQRIDERAREQLKDHPLFGLMPAVHYHEDGKITHRTNGGEDNVERHSAFLVGMHLVIVEGLLRRFLVANESRLHPTSLIDALAEWPHLSRSRRALLVHASARFAARDWVSSAYMVATQFEAVLRDLLRAAGYHALKVERDGVLMDETLNSLLRGAPARDALGEAFCSLSEYVLCDHSLGWNLRNEIAHGTINPGSLSPARVLLLWLLIVRISCLTAVAPLKEEQADGTGQDEVEVDKAENTAAPAEAPSALGKT